MPLTLDELLAINDPNTFAVELTDAIWGQASVDFDEMSEAEQTAFCIDGLEREVNNGGFNQFFFNSAGDQAVQTVAALHRIGAHAAAALVERANGAFGIAGPSSDRNARQKQIESLGEQSSALWEALDNAFLEYPDALARLLQEYVRMHRAEFRHF